MTLLSDPDFDWLETETVEFLRMGELAEERREIVGAKDCSKGLGSRSKFDLAIWACERLASVVGADASGGGCCCF